MRQLVVVGSVTGAPGVTTTALAVAAAWPSEVDGGVRPVVVEADVSGGDLMIRFGLPAAPSLLDVAAAAGQPHPGSLLGAVGELPFGVRVVAAVPGRGPCREAVRLLAGEGGQRVLLGDDHDRGTVLLDVGRLTEDVQPLLAAADQMVLVTRGGAEPLTHVSACGLDADAGAGRLTLAVVGPCPYSAEEIAHTLGIRQVLFLPWDAKSVAAMNTLKPGALRTTGLRPLPLMSAARTLACRLAGQPGSGIRAGHVDGDCGTEGSGAPLVGGSRTGAVHVPGVEESGT
ncbi:MinD/ParA family protein [Streptomyces sp. NPDC001848]|uniref:MinD/ParA family ATP-binding protein n=1 Tax=Streptomyces sp. NPDC001848 TaxID=3364618 RepID=UPI0036C69065